MKSRSKLGPTGDVKKVTPFVRQQVRWALSRYRANRKIGVPRLLNDVIGLLGDEVSDELSTQDIYNFLDNGRETRPHKVHLLLSFLQEKAPEYVNALSFDQFGITTADFIQAYSDGLKYRKNRGDGHFSLNEFQTELFFSAKKDGSLDDSWMERGHQYTFDGVDFTIFAVRYPGAGSHILFHSFNMYLNSGFFDQARLAPSSDEGVETTFNEKSLSATIETLENLIFSEQIPISEKSHGVIINGNYSSEIDARKEFLLMRRGIEPGAFFDKCEIRRFESGPYKGQRGISMHRHSYFGDENKFATRETGLYPLHSMDRLLDDYLDNSEADRSKKLVMFIPFKSKSLQEFVDGFDWGNV